MGKSLFIVLAVCIMSSGVHGESESMSCSMVNGRTICNRQRGQGNAAMASSSSFSGQGGSSQQTYAGAGSPGDWQSSGQKISTGNGGPPPSSDYFDFDRTEFQGAPGRFDEPVVGGSSYSSSSSAVNFGTDSGPTPVVGGFGFASAGNVFRPEFANFAPANTPQDSSEPNGGPPVSKNFGNDNSDIQVSTRVFAGGPLVGGMTYSYSSSVSAPNFDTNEGSISMSTIGGFGGSSVGGMSYSYSSTGSAPNFDTNEGPIPTGGGFGFASAGNVFSPGFPFSYVSGFANGPQQDTSRPNGGGFAGGYPGGFPGRFRGGYAGAAAGAGPANFGQPGGFNPMEWVFGRRY